MPLKEELGLRESFKHREHEVLLGIYYTASILKKKADEFFRTRELTDVQFNVLMLLKSQCGEEGGLTQVELSRMMLVNRANITSLVDRMEKANLVTRVATPGDRRYNLIKMTKRGERIFMAVAEEYHHAVDEVMGALNDSEKKTLSGLLEKLRKHLPDQG
ncbi:MAG: hypothetical protein AMXMBFR84_22430 [Candidatus Hydrogenedentota bacterium]